MRQAVSLVITVLVVLSFLIACAQPTPTKPTAPTVATTAPAPAVATKPAVAAPTSVATKPAAAAPAAKIKRGGILRGAYSNEWAPNLDPHAITGNPFGFELVYDTLVRTSIEPKTGARTNKPGLAETWEQPDQKTIVMKLRKNVVFQDGSKFDASVAKWNIDRMRTYAKSAAKTDVAVIDSVDVVDDYTIKVNLKGAPAGILYRLGDSLTQRAWIAPKATIDKEGDEALTRRMIGSGPMVFVEWLTGDRITLKKWDKYWENGEDGQPLPYLDGVIMRVIVDEAVRVTEIRTGNLDVAAQVEPRNYTAIRNDTKLELIEYSWIGLVNYIIFNVEKEPFKDLKLRQAALYAIDRDAIAKGAGQGVGKPTYYFWGPGDLGYDETLPRYSYDVNKAKQLIQDSAYKSGVDVVDEFFQSDPMVRTAQALKQAWDPLGIRTTLNLQERTAFVSKTQNGNFHVANSLRQWGESDPEAYSYRLDSSGAFNFAQFKNADMDKCLAEGRNTAEDAKRAEIYKRCQKIVFEQAPYDQVWFSPNTLVLNKAVKGWEPSHFVNIVMRKIWLDR